MMIVLLLSYVIDGDNDNAHINGIKDDNNNDGNDNGMVSSISCNDDYDIIALIDYYIH